MCHANPTWGAPRIHGELLKLGIAIAEATVGHYMVRRRPPPSQTWRTFLTNHIGQLVSVDFFVVPTLTFRVLFVFVVLAHDRRQILHVNVTGYPTAAWTAQQIRNAFPWDTAPRFLLRDRDGTYGHNFRACLEAMEIDEVLTAPQSPWQNCLGAQLAISVNNCPPLRDPRSRMTSFKRTQRKYVQKAYRVRNWREYETGLRARGSLTVWLGLTDGKLANWNSPRPTRRKPGRQRKYSNHAIETTVTLGLVFGLASRQTEGFLRSLLTLLNLDNDVPDHSTISRRKARLGKVASYERRTVKPVHLRIDSSGLSVHVGQLRTPPKARDYRKLHLAVDEHTSDVVVCELTSKRARDASRVASLVGQIERPIASAKADAAYDTGDVYKTLENHRAHRSPKVLIPPRTGAQLALDSAGTRQRNRNIRARSRVGKRKWYVASGYSRRSKVETTFHRYKAILGSAMRARGLASQRVEVRLGCKILNTMTALGIPDGEMIG